MDERKKYVCLPPLKVSGIGDISCSYEAYVALLCEIPYGMLVTDTMFYKCIEKVYGYENLQIDYSLLTTHDMSERLYPFWRLVTTRGHLPNWNVKGLQRKMLESEGHIVVRPKPNEEGLVVQDYKDKLFDLDSLHITVRQDIGELHRAYIRTKKAD